MPPLPAFLRAAPGIARKNTNSQCHLQNMPGFPSGGAGGEGGRIGAREPLPVDGEEVHARIAGAYELGSERDRKTP